MRNRHIFSIAAIKMRKNIRDGKKIGALDNLVIVKIILTRLIRESRFERVKLQI